VVLDAIIDSAEYLWSTGEKTKTITVNKAGNYTLLIKKGNCEILDNAHLKLSKLLKFEIAPISLCDSLERTLSLDPKNTYKWFDNSTGNKITLREKGDYWVEINDGNILIYFRENLL